METVSNPLRPYLVMSQKDWDRDLPAGCLPPGLVFPSLSQV